jgi:hypothetical protein
MAKKLLFMISGAGKTQQEIFNEAKEALEKQGLLKDEREDNGLLDLADDDPQLGVAWWLHESGQVQTKLSRAGVDKINNYVRNHPYEDMWEIGYDD